MAGDQDQKQRAGDGSVNLQAGRDIVIGALTVADVASIAEMVFERNLPAMREQALAEARENCRLFLQTLTTVVAEHLTEAEMGKFASADMQYALVHASMQASRRNDADKCKLLASLLAHKAKATEDILDLAITQAIEVAPKLSAGQLHLVAFVFLMRHFRSYVPDYDALKAHVQKLLNDFGKMNLGEAAVSTVVALGCAIFEMTTSRFEEKLEAVYKDLLPIRSESKFFAQYDQDKRNSLRSELGLNEEQIAVIEKFNTGNAHALYLTAIGRVIAFSHLEQRSLISFDWKPYLDL